VPESPSARPIDPLVVAAMALPTLAAWIYFVALEGSPLARPAYAAAKVVQFSLPVLAWAAARGGVPRLGLGRGGWRLAAVGLSSGLLLAGGLAAVYFGWLAGSPLAEEAAARVGRTLEDFRIAGPAGYLAMAAALSIVHSLLEELYWRGFVFARLAAALPAAPAAALASLAFASHHLIVVARYLPPGRSPVPTGARSSGAPALSSLPGSATCWWTPPSWASVICCCGTEDESPPAAGIGERSRSPRR
jgi:membrane protease YdiL (CAAX protease family)